MKSTIDYELIGIDGNIFLTQPKELPNWYEIEDIGFIDNRQFGEWSNCEIEYKGERIDVDIVEEEMYERYEKDCEGTFSFDIYMKKHAKDVYEFIDELIELRKNGWRI